MKLGDEYDACPYITPMIIRKLSQISKGSLNNQKTLQNHPIIRNMLEEEAFNKNNYDTPNGEFCCSQDDIFFSFCSELDDSFVNFY